MEISVSDRGGRGAGKSRAAALAAALAALALALSATACAGGGGGGHGALGDMLRLLPRDATGAVYVDAAVIFGDAEMRHYRLTIPAMWKNTAGFQDKFDISLWDAEYFAFARVNRNAVFLLGGLPNLDELRGRLGDLGYDEHEISSVEAWTGSFPHWQAVAFLSGGRVLISDYESDMRDVLRRSEEGRASLHDDVEDMVSDLPSGLMMGVGECLDRDGCFNATAVGKPVSGEFRDEFRAVTVTRYDDEDGAAELYRDLRDETRRLVLDGECSEAEVERDLERVTLELVCPDRFGFFGVDYYLTR